MAVKEIHMVNNGVDMDSLGSTVQAIKENPKLGKSKFRVHNLWISGGHNTTEVGKFFALGREIEHKRMFDLYADEPAVAGGKDEAANPVEHLLHALASCVTTSIVAHAAVNGIEIEELESQLEGDIDLRGFLGLDNSVPRGYQNIRISFKVKTDPNNIDKLRKLALFSPVYNSLTQGTYIELEIKAA
jgi:uncharacterized OsmC-like protein